MPDEEGYFEPNEPGIYSVNKLSATANAGGSCRLHFGGDPGSTNYLPITGGWNYAVRFYPPRREILDGTWTFPGVRPVDERSRRGVAAH